MKYKLEINRDIVAYSDLWHTADVLLSQASKVEIGRTHIIRASLVFRAFAFEAFLLHVGKKLFSENNDYLYFPIKNKLIYIDQKYSMEINLGVRPFQTITILFDKRDKLAHAKDDKIINNYATNYGNSAEKHYEKRLKTDIENYCIIENAIIAKEDARRCIETIADRVGIDKIELFRMGMESGSMEVT
jgi:hypothetical protein